MVIKKANGDKEINKTKLKIYNYIFIMVIIIMAFVQPVSATWWDSDWDKQITSNVENGSRPYQMKVTVNYGTGSNTASNVYCNNSCNADFSDIRFTLENVTPLPFWIQEKTDSSYAIIWVNNTNNGSVNMYYENPLIVSSASDIFTTGLTGSDDFTELEKYINNPIMSYSSERLFENSDFATYDDLTNWTVVSGTGINYDSNGCSIGGDVTAKNPDNTFAIPNMDGEYGALCTEEGGDTAVGVAKSQNFTISTSYINFFTSGWDGVSGQSGVNRIELLYASNDTVIFTTEEPLRETWGVNWWNVTTYQGTSAYIKVIDANSDATYAWIGATDFYGSDDQWQDRSLRIPALLHNETGKAILGQNGQYWNFYTASTFNNTKRDLISTTGLGFSTDLKSWTKATSPLLPFGNSSSFDYNQLSDADVIEVDDIYWMFYVGTDRVDPAPAAQYFEVGVAYCPTSLDCTATENWTKYTNATTGNSIIEPVANNRYFGMSVLYEDNTWKMWIDQYYNGVGEQIDYIYSTEQYPNTTSWTKYAGNPVFSITEGCGGAGIEAGQPSVFKHNGVYYLTYHRHCGTGNINIGLASSADGISWTTNQYNPIIGTSSGKWDSVQAHTPYGTLINDSYYVLYGGAPVLTNDQNMWQMGLVEVNNFSKFLDYTQTWTGEVGTWNLLNGYYTGTPDTSMAVASHPSEIIQDAEIISKVKMIEDKGANEQVCVFTRANNVDTDVRGSYIFNLMGDPSQLEIYEADIPSGGGSIGTTAISPAVALDTWYTMDVNVIGSQLNFTVGSDHLNVSDSTYNSSGIFGVRTYHSVASYDWFFVKSLIDSEPVFSTWSVSQSESEDSTPPASTTNLTNTTTNFNHNWTWTNPVDADFSHSMIYINGVWTVNSSNEHYNLTASAHNTSTISTHTVDTTGNINTTWVNHTSTIPNNAISISGISSTYTINEGETLSIDANYTDADGDTPTFADNSTEWNVNSGTGVVSWSTVDGDDGTYNWYINVTDGYGSVDTQAFSVSVNNSIYSPELEKVSFSPSPFNTNYTGVITISYLVNSSESLNLSTLAFVYGVNYTITSDMHNYIRAPSNTLAFEGIYRAPYRNVTPYLSWETNNTITNNNVWQWGGYDNSSTQVSSSVVNSTHTWINVTGYTEDVLPSSHYIKKAAMYDAPKTGFEVSRAQGLIFKMWNVEEIRNRDSNYLANLYFDTSWESTLPTYPIEIGFCNDSYDPTVDDIDTCTNCVKIGEWNGTRWVNHSWDPGANASYASPLVVNGSQYTDPSPDDINYIWLRSNTISSKSYVLNATDYDPGITNISYNETNVMWTYNEINSETDAVSYTPSFFTTYVRNDLDMLHQLYVANDQDDWGQTGILSEEIGISSIPVPAVSFEHFCRTLDTVCVNDTDMDATYDNGTLKFNIHAPADPDGGPVDHNITLHYANNQTLAGIINNTLTTTGDEYVDISFDTTSYYSSTDYYTLRCESVDDEGSTATKWLISNFTLDADGNQGWISNGAVNFWGFNDIPTLYTTISNNSLISYNAGDDIYTMHIPFFKSKYNDTFNFNETVHLKSLNNEDVAYFRFIGENVFDTANIHAWNTTSSSFAPITDEYRGYVYSSIITSGNIDNSNFSYLGSDLYRQEGLNFVGTTNAYTINNTIFSHNAEGLIMENCANFTISNSTISDNVNVGLGVYFTNNTIVENNTMTSNGGRGVSVYEGHNNIIRYNTITESGIHGIHMWSNSQNNTCIGNNITGSTIYDYYLSSSSTDNYIIDPASSTDKIRVTSTSSVNIENTDNAAFSEDSLNTSYAYLTNFSMYVSGVSQTFDITQHNAIITPSTDKLSIWNLEWDDTLTFNASSETALNPTWFNITNTSWASSIINVSINGTLITTENTDANGLLTYNYTDTYSEKWFEFQLYSSIPTPTPTPVPTATPPPSGGSSSGTGTTGVGTSDEPLYNIDCRETGRIRNLQAGTETYYRTTKPDCTDIIKVTFTPTQNSGEQPILIEKLHNMSRFVTTPAPHVTYSNFNLYVGLFSYDEKTTNEKILFKVSKDWATTNNVTPESVTLYIFEPSTTSWKSLPTTLSHTDTLYYVYESESGATYGRFAIVGTDKVSLNIIELITEKIENIIPSINISESKFVTGATSLYNNLKEYIINLLPTSISFDTIYNIFDNENASTYIMAILTLILIAIISYFYNYEHGLIAGLIAIILMIIITILQDTALISIMSVEAGNIIISTVAYTTIAFIISYIIGEKLK